MMELSFDFISILETIERQPVYVVFWAAFGMFFCSIVLFVPVIILRKLNKTAKIDNGIGLVASILLLCWIIGFVTQMILFFSGVSGIKLFFIWMAMFLTYVVFGVFNKNMILKWSATLTKTNKSATPVQEHEAK
ncbi:hypothetical protein [Niastella populi]|uniref:Uncharacterized protein n=1 Tax=Niastella populi TaxID=550983 RepID=A0A1V9FJX2_9BACT|nr:hypothetical protein [Niastella populi]OQP58581.1 hypothetical protein A4R26_03765 [Niastella populi]